ncbi:hypothetical protein DAEQUDRAFT_111876 [Daedalea quercina L-15889]|uniref:Uncharacterized protein n=1 Tax=Daedalea quercina L-15889 TaxID=1314783 RepID=A0A165S5I1_9APHY|nr:hypothetical protein DAEQUDRAFT_111876 [Daedalea quercina L-15889]
MAATRQSCSTRNLGPEQKKMCLTTGTVRVRVNCAGSSVPTLEIWQREKYRWWRCCRTWVLRYLRAELSRSLVCQYAATQPPTNGIRRSFKRCEGYRMLFRKPVSTDSMVEASAASRIQDCETTLRSVYCFPRVPFRVQAVIYARFPLPNYFHYIYN